MLFKVTLFPGLLASFGLLLNVSNFILTFSLSGGIFKLDNTELFFCVHSEGRKILSRKFAAQFAFVAYLDEKSFLLTAGIERFPEEEKKEWEIQSENHC